MTYKFQISKEEQIEAVLWGNPLKWAVQQLRSKGWKGELGDGGDPTRFLVYEDFITVEPDEIFDVAKKSGIEQFCNNYLRKGEGSSIYKDNEGNYIHSSTERGEERIIGVFGSLPNAERSLIDARIKYAKFSLSSRSRS